ncbi:MAG TPA: alanine racemase, partial [Ktedonobacterales bacterium]
MIPLDDLITATGAEVLAAGASTALEGFAHDSRMVAPGDCFVAVRGVHGDGHDFLLDAAERDARALLVERARLAPLLAAQSDLLERLRRAGAAVLVVEETRAALRRYAAHILARWRPLVVAVAGSAGKTTTKEAIADVLSLRGHTFRSWRNFNDALGLPLALGRLEPTHQFAVLEMGADHPGEIAELCEIARPQMAVVTNVSATHLRYFGTVEALGEELARLPASLPADGLAVLNADDPLVRAMAGATPARACCFGPLTPGAAVEAAHPARFALLPLGEAGRTALTLRPLADGEDAPLDFPHLHGDHWAGVVLAALTVGAAVGVPQAAALAALRELEPLPGRMRWLDGTAGTVLLDDSHNAAPASVAAGLAALSGIAAARGAPRIAVLGDMLRLGAAEEAAHQALGALAARHCDYLVTRGLLAERVAEAAARAGLAERRIAVTHTAEDAATAALAFAERARAHAPARRRAPAVIYIKGSEELRMEHVTARLLAHPARAEQLLDRQTQAWQRVLVMRPDRPTWLEIDLSAIGQNTRRIKEIVGERVQVLASLKADAYGHGALRVARTVLRNGAAWLGVATVSEALPLREAGIAAPILVFGYVAPWQAREAVRLDLRATVYGLDSARALSQAACDLGREARVHVKVDTGMARLGLRAEEIPAIVAFCRALGALPGLIVEGVFTHFATADSADQTYARR